MYRDLILLGFTPLILQACTPTEAQLLNCGESECIENGPFVVLGSFSDSSDGKSQMSPALMQVSPLTQRPTPNSIRYLKAIMSFSVAALQWWCSILVLENKTTCVFFPLHLLLPSCKKSKIHTWTHTGYLSTLGWRFNREFWNSPSGFLWKTLMEKAVVLGAFDGRVWLYAVRRAKRVPLGTTFVLPADSEWLFSMAGKVRERGHTTEPNLSYKATLQATEFTLLIPSSFMFLASAPQQWSNLSIQRDL